MTKPFNGQTTAKLFSRLTYLPGELGVGRLHNKIRSPMAGTYTAHCRGQNHDP